MTAGAVDGGKAPQADLAAFSTPDASPWADRAHVESGDDPRRSYQRDRDRIIHCSSFRKLQHKTQVFVVHEGDFFRTRLTHTLEVAQIGRTIAHMLGLTEALVEAICLGHDLGHTPFGHAGEEALENLLAGHSLTWNSNAHSLTVVEDLEVQYCGHRGLNLTWATREGLARHSTKFDSPTGEKEYAKYAQPSLESQIADVADVIAYGTHDTEDALAAQLVDVGELAALNIDIWDTSWQKAEDEFSQSHPSGTWPGVDRDRLLPKRARRHIIDFLIRNVVDEAGDRVCQSSVSTLEEARALDQPLVGFSTEVKAQVDRLLTFMYDRVYKSPLVARQNHRAWHILSHIFEALSSDPRLLPEWAREQIPTENCPAMHVARFLAGLTDRSAADLYAELFEPSDRAMGHRIS